MHACPKFHCAISNCQLHLTPEHLECGSKLRDAVSVKIDTGFQGLVWSKGLKKPHK